jgi:hypothetical protein
MGEMGGGNGRLAVRKTNPQGRTTGRIIAVVAAVVVVGLVVFAIVSWAQYNAVEHADGYGLAGEVHPASGSAFPTVPVGARYCPSSFCGTATTLQYNWGGVVTGWAGRYTGKHGNCMSNEFQSGVWLRVKYQGASSGETDTLWVPYECVNWTDSHEQDVHFSTPGGKPGVGPSDTNALPEGTSSLPETLAKSACSSGAWGVSRVVLAEGRLRLPDGHPARCDFQR